MITESHLNYLAQQRNIALDTLVNANVEKDRLIQFVANAKGIIKSLLAPSEDEHVKTAVFEAADYWIEAVDKELEKK